MCICYYLLARISFVHCRDPTMQEAVPNSLSAFWINSQCVVANYTLGWLTVIICAEVSLLWCFVTVGCFSWIGEGCMALSELWTLRGVTQCWKICCVKFLSSEWPLWSIQYGARPWYGLVPCTSLFQVRDSNEFPSCWGHKQNSDNLQCYKCIMATTRGTEPLLTRNCVLWRSSGSATSCLMSFDRAWISSTQSWARVCLVDLWSWLCISQWRTLRTALVAGLLWGFCWLAVSCSPSAPRLRLCEVVDKLEMCSSWHTCHGDAGTQRELAAQSHCGWPICDA